MKTLGYIMLTLILAFVGLVLLSNSANPSKAEMSAMGDWLYTTCVNEAKANDRMDNTQDGICSIAADRVRDGEVRLSSGAIKKFNNGLDWDGSVLEK